jgi:hypothetical protein
MGIRIPGRVTKTQATCGDTCWSCGLEYSTGEELYEMNYNDECGQPTDCSGYVCTNCAEDRDWIFCYETDLAYEKKMRERYEEEAKRRKAKALEEKMRFQKATNAFWADKINVVFA